LNGHKGKSGTTPFKDWGKEISDLLTESSSYPEDVDVFEARKALQTGKVQPVANYLRDLAERLRRRANLAGTKVVSRKRRRIPVATGNADLQVEEPQGNQELLESFDRDAAFLEHLAATLDGAPGSWGWRLQFVRRHRGRPTDRVARMFRDSRVARDLASATQHSGKGGSPGKQESAITDLGENQSISRATIMRAKRRHKGKQQSKNK
jgi:hypothetical protein